MSLRALLLINRFSRHGQRHWQQAVDQLRVAGVMIVMPDPSLSIAEAIDRHAAEVDRVIVGGGDGSLNAAADALNASSESPRRHDRASAVPLQPALATTWSKRGWRTSAVASGRPVGLPDSRMALRNRLVEVRPYERNSYEMAAAPAL